MDKLFKVRSGMLHSVVWSDLIPLVTKRTTKLGQIREYKIELTWLKFYIALYFRESK